MTAPRRSRFCFSGRSGKPMRFGLAPSLLALFLVASAYAEGRGADGQFERRSSSHFDLFQDVDIDRTGGFHGSRRFEQEVLDELEGAYDKLDKLLSLRPERRISVIVYDPERFDAEFRGLFRFQAAGFYHGVIRIRGGTTLTPRLSRVLHHELMHAALDAEAPNLILPGWVNEGGAEWFEARASGKRGLSGWERQVLAGAAASGGLYPISRLAVPAFGGLDSEAASLAYLQSYAYIDLLARRYGERKLASFYADLLRTKQLDRALSRIYRLDVAGLDAALRKDLE